MSNAYARLSLAESELKDIKARSLLLEHQLKGLRQEFTTAEAEVTPPPISKPVKKAVNPETDVIKTSPPPLPEKIKLKAKTGGKPAVDRQELELQMGRVWFVRLGMLLMLTGIVFLGNYAYQTYVTNFGPGLRLGLIYTAAALMTGLGIFFERTRESLRSYGRTLAAGGLAVTYYATFAAHNVSALKVIDSPVIAAIALTLSALLFVAYAQWKQSPGSMAASLGMAFYATTVNPIGWMSCLSALILSTIGIGVFVKNRWHSTGFVSLIAAYTSFAWWQLLVSAPGESTHWFLPSYWVLFTLATFCKNFADRNTNHSLFLGLNNGFFFGLFSLSLLRQGQQEQIWILAIVMGALALGITFLKPQKIRSALLSQAVGLLTLGFILKLSGYQLFIVLMVEALMLAGIARRKDSTLFEIFASIVAGISALLTFQTMELNPELPRFVWVIAPLLWLGFGILMRKNSPHLFTIGGTITTVMTFIILIGGSLRSLAPENITVTLVAFGLAGALASRFKLTRRIGTEFLLALQAVAIIASVILLEQQNHIATACISSLGFYLISYWSGEKNALHDEERELLPILQWVHLTLTTIFTGVLIHLNIESDIYRTFLYLSIPLTMAFIARLTGEEKLHWIPPHLYLAIFPTLFIGETWLILISALTMWGHFAITGNSKVRKNILLLLGGFLWIVWICREFQNGYGMILLSFSGLALLFAKSILKTRASGVIAMGYFLISVLGSWLTSGDFLTTYLCLAAPLGWYLWKSYRGEAEGFGALAVISLLLFWIRFSEHTLHVSENGMAMTWAILGTVTLLVGLGCMSRAMRYMALLILGASLLHVGFVDIWKLDPLPRILSLLTLGSGLLGLGFVYNRWHEHLKKWL